AARKSGVRPPGPLRLPGVAAPQRCQRGFNPELLRSGALRPRVRLRQRRLRPPSHRGRRRHAGLAPGLLHLPGILLLEDAGGDGRRRLRSALRGPEKTRRALRVLPSPARRANEGRGDEETVRRGPRLRRAGPPAARVRLRAPRRGGRPALLARSTRLAAAGGGPAPPRRRS